MIGVIEETDVKEMKWELLDKIDNLNSLHPESTNRICNDDNCEICKKLRYLGRQYEELTLIDRKRRRYSKSNPHHHMIDSIIEKGKHATKEEIRHLVEVEGMTKREVAKLLRMPNNNFLELCRHWGIGITRKKA